MKKLLMMLGVMLFSASVFALNAADTNKFHGKATFEKTQQEQEDRFVIKNIMLQLADPLATMTDEQAQPLAVCYVSYQIKGKSLASYVRMHAEQFDAKGAHKEAAKMRDFAARIEVLSEKVDFDKMSQQDSDYFIAQNILINYADPFLHLSDADAAAKAKYYAHFEVKGQSLETFVREIAVENPEFDLLNGFVNRINRLTK
ncbi:MAG: hypothetical protein IJ266_00285 [Elusimicrobiaceae bacterium]|nr:hypothetical protein [Elusimicrobiaceae bacterium]